MEDQTVPIDRRRLLMAIGALSASGLAGCLGAQDLPDPVTIGDVECDQCGMIVTRHPGPSGQAFYEEGVLEDRDEGEPAYFCASLCAYRYIFDKQDEGHDPIVLYLTDYSTVDYDVWEDTDILFISAHLDAEDFGRADDLTLVIRSDVTGAMGPAVVPFSEGADVEAFIDQYGGETVAHEDVDRELLVGLEQG